MHAQTGRIIPFIGKEPRLRRMYSCSASGSKFWNDGASIVMQVFERVPIAVGQQLRPGKFHDGLDLCAFHGAVAVYGAHPAGGLGLTITAAGNTLLRIFQQECAVGAKATLLLPMLAFAGKADHSLDERLFMATVATQHWRFCIQVYTMLDFLNSLTEKSTS